MSARDKLTYSHVLSWTWMESYRSDELMSLWVDGSILPHVLVDEVGLNNSNLYDEEL